MTWAFRPLKPRHYRILYADPAWKFIARSIKGLGKSPDRHYRTMTLEQLAALPVQKLAHPEGAALICWIYDPMIAKAVWLIETCWQFEIKTRLFDWPKETTHGLDAYGQGYYSRHGGEQCWIATRGAPPKVLDKSIRQYQRLKLREHSRKPDEFRLLIERMFDGPYCELFSRTDREGWECWGDEAGKYAEELAR